MRFRIALVVALGVSLPTALACSLAGPNEVRGFFGFGDGGGFPIEGEAVPANAASLVDFPGATTHFDTAGGFAFHRIPPGTTAVELQPGLTLPVTEAADESPPSAPVIEDAWLEVKATSAGRSCDGSHARYYLEVSGAVDDRAAPEHLTYLVYEGSEPDLGGSIPTHFLAPEAEPPTADEGRPEPNLWYWGEEADRGSERWVMVRVADQAGNVSAASEPFLVDTGEAPGCAAGGRGGAAGLALPALMALLLLRRRR